MQPILIGCDSDGLQLKQKVVDYLKDKGLPIQDYGVMDISDPRPYYEVAAEIAQKVAQQQAKQAILICGTGMGMAIIANKFPGVYASVCEHPQAAFYARSINNSNVLTLGQMLTTPEMAYLVIDTWLNTAFMQGCSASSQKWLQESMQAIATLGDKKS